MSNFEIETELQNVIDIVYTHTDEYYSTVMKKSQKLIYADINERVENKLYEINTDNIINTLVYVYENIRSGIYVRIENNKIKHFIPFANPNFENNWHHNIKLFGVNKNSKTPVEDFLRTRKQYIRYDKNYIPDMKNWWVNAFIINNELWENSWGEHSLVEYYDIIDSTLHNRKINNVSFIINKRDHPLLRKDLCEPYTKLYPNLKKIKDDYKHNNFIPILSPYSNSDYMDIPFIIPQDWNLVNNDESYYKPNESDIVPWENKIETLLFRGGCTGPLELEYNQRLQITKLNNQWYKSKRGLLDAGIVSWNSRDKIRFDLTIDYIKPKELNKKGIWTRKRIPMNEQLKYKYILDIDGHSKTNRMSYLLQSECLIFITESKYVTGNLRWYDILLDPYVHYIPVKYDFSDLESQILWARDHDDECKEIAKNAKKLYNEYFNKEAIYDYCEYLFNSM